MDAPLGTKVIIAHSAEIENVELIAQAVAASELHISEAVVYTARKYRSLGELYADSVSLPVRTFPVCWSAYGKHAVFMRNHDMVEYSDAAIVVWSGIPKKDEIRHLIRVCCHPAMHFNSSVDPKDRTIPCFVYHAQKQTGAFISPEYLYLLDQKSESPKKARKKS